MIYSESFENLRFTCGSLFFTRFLICILVLFNFCLFFCLPLTSETHNNLQTSAEFTFVPNFHLAKQTEPPKILFRHLYNHSSYVYIASINKLYQLHPKTLSVISTRESGPKNFSVFRFCYPNSCSNCLKHIEPPWPYGYSLESCGPRPTDAFVKAWATSSFADPKSSLCESSFSGSDYGNVLVNDDAKTCEDALYVCYNVFHGYCERLLLSNISVSQTWTDVHEDRNFHSRVSPPVAVVNWNASLSSSIVVDRNFVYAGVELDRLQDAILVPLDPLSVRLKNFEYFSKAPSPESTMKLSVSDFRSQYKFSFHYVHAYAKNTEEGLDNSQQKPQIYFILQQPETIENGPWSTRISRICAGDTMFASYVEINLNFKNSEHTHKGFNVLHLASRGTIGSRLGHERFLLLSQESAFSFRRPIEMSEDFYNVLLVAFVPQAPDPLDHGYLNSRDIHLNRVNSNFYRHRVVRGTVIALYTLAEVDARFSLAIYNCLRGEGSSGLAHFTRVEPFGGCVRDDALLLQLRYNGYCPTQKPLNWPISGSSPSESLIAPQLLEIEVEVTGMVITAVADEFTVLLVVTNEGFLHKYEVEVGHVRLISSKRLTRNQRPLHGLALDESGLVAFAISDSVVYRVELQNCSPARSCGVCLQMRDPHCGWCVSEGQCTDKALCFARSPDSPPFEQSSWLSYTKLKQCPVILHVSPPGMESHESMFSVPGAHWPDTETSARLANKRAHIAPILQISRQLPGVTGRFPAPDRRRRLLCTFREAPSTNILNLSTDYGASSQSGDAAKEPDETKLETLLSITEPGAIIDQTDATAMLNSDEVQCSSPDISRLPKLPPDATFLNVIVWLEVASENSKTYPSLPPLLVSDSYNRQPMIYATQSLAAGLFSVYDCRRFSDCRSCARSRFGCAWCLAEGRCLSVNAIQHGATCSVIRFPEQIFSNSLLSEVVTVQVENCSLIRTASKCSCPRFTVLSNQLFVASLTPISVVLQVFTIGPLAAQFICSETCSGQQVVGIFDQKNATVVCNFKGIAMPITGEVPVDERPSWHPGLTDFTVRGVISCPIQLFWHLNESVHLWQPLANEDNSSVEVYECGRMAQHCDSCLALPQKFHCGWCQSTSPGSSSPNQQGFCTSRAACHPPIAFKKQWLQQPATCQNPQIVLVSPLYATFDGRATLTIRGINLGRLNMVSVTVVGASITACIIQPSSILPSRQFKCRLGLIPVPPVRGPVVNRLYVNISGTHVISTNIIFVTPSVEKFEPTRGPIAGGTLIRIFGNNLNIGSHVRVDLHLISEGQSSACAIETLLETMITCRTTEIHVSSFYNGETAQVGFKSTLVISHDDSRTVVSDQSFSFTLNPDIQSVSKFSVLLGGGTSLRAYGTHLDVVAEPMIVFYYKGSEYRQQCQFTLGQLVCVSPSLQDPINIHEKGALLLPRKYPSNKTLDAFVELRPHLHTKIQSISPALLALLHGQLAASVQVDPELIEASGSIDAQFPEPDGRREIIIPFGFILDNVTSLLLIGSLKGLPNPRVHLFPDGVWVEPLTEVRVEEPIGTFYTSEDNTDRDNISPMGTNTSNVLKTASVTGTKGHHLLRLHGQFEALVASPELRTPEELSILVGGNRTCHVTAVTLGELRCDLSRQGLLENEKYLVEIRFGQLLVARPGRLQFKKLGLFGGRERLVFIVASVLGIVFLLLSLLGFLIWYRFSRLEQSLEAKFQQRWTEQEKCVARAFKQDFMELQMHMVEFTQDLSKSALPIRDYQSYCLFALFPDYHNELVQPCDPHVSPNLISVTRPFDDSEILPSGMTTHPLVSKFQVSCEIAADATRAIFLFNHLLCNRHFLFLLVQVIEEDDRITARDRSRIASLLSIILQPNMDYLTHMILVLISDLLQTTRNTGGDSKLRTAFRRSECVVAKMLSNWFSFLLYNFIKDRAGEHLFFLYRALLQELNTGPRDAVTGNARYTLDTGSLLKTDFRSSQLLVYVADPEGIFNFGVERLPVKLLFCDTITQAKLKILDAIYRNAPYSKQIKPIEILLEKSNESNGKHQLDASGSRRCRGIVMSDCDYKVRRNTRRASQNGPPFPVNCLQDYRLTNHDVINLVRCPPPHCNSFHCNRGSGPLHQNSLLLCSEIDCNYQSLPFSNTSFKSTAFHNDSDSVCNCRLNGSASATDMPPRCYQIMPTAPPNPQLWYHLEKPNTDGPRSKGALPSERHQCDDEETHVLSTSSSPLCHPFRLWRRFATSMRVLRCGPRVRVDSGLPGVDAAGVRRWLETDAVSLISSGIPSYESRRPSLRLRRFSRRWQRKSPNNRTELQPISKCASPTDDLDLDRPTTQLPCEVFLNRLLKTKMSVLDYLRKVVDIIFGVVVDSQNPPICIKFLFDFLDHQAVQMGINDSDMVHAWKSNCLYLRFWNQILTNLDYVFDIPLLRNTALDRSFQSFSQAITEACSPVLEKVTKDSPFNKALFSDEIEKTWERVRSFYSEMKSLPAVPEQDMSFFLREHSKKHKKDFNLSWALYELFTCHVYRCYDKLCDRLSAADGSPSPLSMVHDASEFVAYSYVDCLSDTHFGCVENNRSFPMSTTNSGNCGVMDWEPLRLLEVLRETRRCMLLIQADCQTSEGRGVPEVSPTSVDRIANLHSKTSCRNPMPHTLSHTLPENFSENIEDGGECFDSNSDPVYFRRRIQPLHNPSLHTSACAPAPPPPPAPPPAPPPPPSVVENNLFATSDLDYSGLMCSSLRSQPLFPLPRSYRERELPPIPIVTEPIEPYYPDLQFPPPHTNRQNHCGFDVDISKVLRSTPQKKI